MHHLEVENPRPDPIFFDKATGRVYSSGDETTLYGEEEMTLGVVAGI